MTEMILLFLTSISDFIKLRVKPLYKLEDVDKVFSRCSEKMLKGGGQAPKTTLDLSETDNDGQVRYYVPTGLMFYRTVREPYMMALSRSQGKKYWFNTVTQQSVFDMPADSVAQYDYCHSRRRLWHWSGEGGITRQELVNYVFKSGPLMICDSRCDRCHLFSPHCPYCPGPKTPPSR